MTSVARATKARRLRSRGAMELARTGMTAEQIAERVGKSRPQITRWLNGERRPGADNRAELAAEFGIEPEAWDDLPSTPTAPPALEPPPPAGAEPDNIPTQQRALRLQRLVHDLMNSVGDDPNATPLEKAKVYASTATTLQLLGRLTGEAQEIGAERILRLPAWRRIEERLVAAVQEHPKAALAIADALRELRE